jgi:maleylpyruvate isomerase
MIRSWVKEGTAYVLDQVAGLTDAQFAEPSRLPGWSRAHVVGHLARNAEGLGRLAAWARTGVETPMYAGREQRAADIERSAQLAPATLRSELRDTADALEAAFDALDADAWQAQVRSAMGRAIPATEVPWLRAKEVWIHAIDLDAGGSFADLPDSMAERLLDEVAAAVGPVDGVTGERAALLGWLTGRTSGEGVSTAGGGPLPELRPWL